MTAPGKTGSVWRLARALILRDDSLKYSHERPKSAGLFSRLRILFPDTYSIVFLAVIVAVFYFPATQAGFVWDDVIITSLRSISDWEGLGRIWFDPVAAYFQTDVAENHYWPIVYTTFWVEHKLWGFSPAGYHVVNILLHFANTVLLWHLLGRLGIPGALFAAALFAVHPVHTESVAWVIGRKDLLSAFFCLASVSQSPSRLLFLWHF